MAAIDEDVPVLKISIDNTDDFDDKLDEDESAIDGADNIELGESKTATIDDDEMEEEPLEVDSSNSTFGQLSKRYENPGGPFVTGVDITAQDVADKKEQRAKRFGIKYNKKPALSAELLKELYESVGITDLEKEERSERGIRLEAIHVRGVDDMGTKDLFTYFGEYGPGSVEWIDDASCNVVWLDPVTSARAMKALSYDPISKQKIKPTKKQEVTEEKKKVEEDEDELNLMSDEEMEQDDSTTKNQEAKNTMEAEDKEKKADRSEGECSTDEEDEEVDGAMEKMPPGKWRVGHKFNKTHRLYLRFATKADKKMPGAEKRSKYYQKYGNPNFGGIKGIISSSRKRRLRAEESRKEEEEARKAVATVGRSISPVISEENNLFDIHNEELSEGFGIMMDRPKERKKGEEDEEDMEEEAEEGEIEEFGVERQRSYGGDPEDPYYEEEFAPTNDPEIRRMEQELQVLLQQSSELEEMEALRDSQPKMRMHADDEEEQIMLRRERAKRLQALQAIHKLDSEIRAARKSGHVTVDTGGDARSRIEARRNKKKAPQSRPNIMRTFAPVHEEVQEEEDEEEGVIREEMVEEEEEEDILSENIPLDKPYMPLKVSCEFDRSDEKPKPDYYSATRWKQLEEQESPIRVDERPKRVEKSRRKEREKAGSHMDRYARREDRNVRGRLGERQHHARRPERVMRQDPKDSHRHKLRSENVQERLEERTRERRRAKDRLGGERIRQRQARDNSPPPPPRQRQPPPPPPPPRAAEHKVGVRRGNMVFVTDSEDSVDEDSEVEVKQERKPRRGGEEEKWPKLTVHVQSDDDDNFDL